MVCYVQLRDFFNGKQAAEKCLKLLEEGTFNWFKYYEMYFVLCMHTEQYDQAFQIYNKIVNHRRFSFLQSNIKEIWKIYGAYLDYLIANGKVPIAEEAKSVFKFKLGKFLNETPIFSKDKRGLNIAILVIQILFLVHQIPQQRFETHLKEEDVFFDLRQREVHQLHDIHFCLFLDSLLL